MEQNREESSKHAQLVSLPLVDQKPNKTQKYLALSFSCCSNMLNEVVGFFLSMSTEGTTALEKSVANFVTKSGDFAHLLGD